jgi:hypothetical protein
MMIASLSVSLILLAQFGFLEAFQSSSSSPAFLARQQQQHKQQHAVVALSASTDEDTEKAAPVITGEELEMMMQDWELPLVVDAYATWYVRFFCFHSNSYLISITLLSSCQHELSSSTRKSRRLLHGFFIFKTCVHSNNIIGAVHAC